MVDRIHSFHADTQGHLKYTQDYSYLHLERIEEC